jgi:hypothetical protein
MWSAKFDVEFVHPASLGLSVDENALPPPQFLIVVQAPGLDKVIAAAWDGVPVQRPAVSLAAIGRAQSRIAPASCGPGLGAVGELTNNPTLRRWHRGGV